MDLLLSWDAAGKTILFYLRFNHEKAAVHLALPPFTQPPGDSIKYSPKETTPAAASLSHQEETSSASLKRNDHYANSRTASVTSSRQKRDARTIFPYNGRDKLGKRSIPNHNHAPMPVPIRQRKKISHMLGINAAAVAEMPTSNKLMRNAFRRPCNPLHKTAGKRTNKIAKHQCRERGH